MSAIDDILRTIPMNQLAADLGTDQDTTKSAAEAAIRSLLGGLEQNSLTPTGEESLAGALSDHARDNHLLDSGEVDLSAVDRNDGGKIVGHILGDQTDLTAQQLGARAGTDASLMQRLLPILAPIVLAYIARQLSGGQDGQGGGILDGILSRGQPRTAGLPGQVPENPFEPAGAPQESSLGGLADILGGMLGGQAPRRQQEEPSGGILGGILGGLFGKS